MPLVSGLPAQQGARWSSTVPYGITELITSFNIAEKDALTIEPTPDIAWASRGTVIVAGVGIVKHPYVLPGSLDFQPFKAGNRHYHDVDAVVQQSAAQAFDLNFQYPLVWDVIGNGYKLMQQSGNTLIEFMGFGSTPSWFLSGGRMEKARRIANLFYTSMGTGQAWGVAPSLFTYPQPNNPAGLPLFTDGTGADGSGKAKHYANPTQVNSARFANLFPAYGTFADKFGDSLTELRTRPNPVWKDVTSARVCTDVIGPTHMFKPFWEMMVQQLALQAIREGGNLAAVASTNPYSYAASMGITEENFIGNPFGPRRFWICPHLDNHPYVLANPNTNGAGKPAQMWINIAAGPGQPTWAKGSANNEECAPIVFFYGAGDPQAQSERRARLEGNLDIDVVPGEPSVIGCYLQV